MEKILKCGCAPVAKDEQGNHVCITHGCREEAPIDLDKALEGREAKCAYCGVKCLSKNHPGFIGLPPFFEYLPDREFDRYYCGCQGWD